MKSHPLPARRRPPRTADNTWRRQSVFKQESRAPSVLIQSEPKGLKGVTILRLFIRRLQTPLPTTAFLDNLRQPSTIRNTGRATHPEGTSMKSATCSSALARIFLVAGFAVALSTMPADAQKAGGSITVGLELDIPGFDPLKVGVYDTA